MSQSNDRPPLVARALSFPEKETFADEGYRENFDRDLSKAVSESLLSYLRGLVTENGVDIKFEIEGNEITASREDGASLSITCFGPDVFDLQRWPSPTELSSAGSLVYDLGNRLNADYMIALCGASS